MKFDVYNDSNAFVPRIIELRNRFGITTHVTAKVHEAFGDNVSYFIAINFTNPQTNQLENLYSAYLSEMADFGLFMYLLQTENIPVKLIQTPTEVDIRHIDLG